MKRYQLYQTPCAIDCQRLETKKKCHEIFFFYSCLKIHQIQGPKDLWSDLSCCFNILTTLLILHLPFFTVKKGKTELSNVASNADKRKKGKKEKEKKEAATLYPYPQNNSKTNCETFYRQ